MREPRPLQNLENLADTTEIRFSVHLPSLLHNIRTYFDETELRDLCFELGYDYADLKGQNRPDKARALVEKCNRTNKLPQLIQLCQRERPDVTWIQRENPQQTMPVTVVSGESTKREKNNKKWIFPIFILGMLLGLGIVAVGLWWQGVQSREIGLDHLLQPAIVYNFNDGQVPHEIREADKYNQFVNGLEAINREPLGDVLKLDLNLPQVSETAPLDEYSGGICFPVTQGEPIHAVRAMLYAPEGAPYMIARMSVPFSDRAWTHSGLLVLNPGEWTPLFWGTEFAYFGDQWYEWLGDGAEEICIWITKNNGYTGPVYLDDIVVYQLKGRDSD